MKTLRNKVTGEVKRLKDLEAHNLTKNPGSNWIYISKSEWKGK